MKARLETLRRDGWMVAVHNDYHLGGVFHTFWLFTHPQGVFIKGEGETDNEALMQCIEAAKYVRNHGWRGLKPVDALTD